LEGQRKKRERKRHRGTFEDRLVKGEKEGGGKKRAGGYRCWSWKRKRGEKRSHRGIAEGEGLFHRGMTKGREAVAVVGKGGGKKGGEKIVSFGEEEKGKKDRPRERPLPSLEAGEEKKRNEKGGKTYGKS